MIEFDQVFEQQRVRLVRLCWLLTLDHDLATEVAQESLARLWRDRERLERDDVDLAAWLRRVAVNLCWDVSRRRSSKRRRGHLVAVPSVVDQSQVDVDLHKAIAGLSTRQRQAVVLRYWDDLDLAGCAEVMGVSVGSVKQHLARAHAALAATSELAREDR
ncbi:MAG: sigma-70 family RNA polymerase sigma factor [Actinomycetia bacterium]|nr:sigma-70 family RNA polymerase sigma factor [Actinomycetes bacterium]